MQATIMFKSIQPFYRALSNAVLFAAKRSDAPIALQAVRFECRATTRALKLVSSDGYRLYVDTVQPTTEEVADAEFSIPVSAAKHLLPILKDAGRFSGGILKVGEDALRVVAGDSEITVPYETAPFPPWERLIPDPKQAVATERIMFNATLLSDLGRLKLPAAGMLAQFAFFGPNKPVLVTVVDGPTLVHMPVRASSSSAASDADRARRSHGGVAVRGSR